jgi:hypothetical protein
MKVIIDMCFILLIEHLINVSFHISCEDLILHLSLAKVCTKIIVYKLIFEQQGCVLSP